MLLFAHTGITLGAAALAAGTLSSRRSSAGTHKSWFAELSRHLDIRLLLLGSMLPDIIDKPVGQYLFRETFSNGRIVSHTLLFLILVSAVGFFLCKYRGQKWLLTLAAGIFTHLLMDEMWLSPVTLFWPLMGWEFPRWEMAEIVVRWFLAIFTVPKLFITELAGLLVLLSFGFYLLIKKKFRSFILRGKVL